MLQLWFCIPVQQSSSLCLNSDSGLTTRKNKTHIVYVDACITFTHTLRLLQNTDT